MLLDEVALKYQGFRLGFSHYVLVVGDPGDHVGNLAGQVGAGSEVRTNAMPKPRRLTDIEDFA